MSGVALITGGSRGIGKAAVLGFRAAGYEVVFTYKSSEDAAFELERESGAIAVRADCESEEQILFAVNKVVELFGRIDVLINNAAVSSFSLVTDLSSAEWERTLRINLTAPFLYSRAVIPYMLREKRGRIINVSSVWGLVGASCEVHYSAAKAGLIGFTKALAKELGPSNITVNAVAPGVIDTDMNRALDEQTRCSLAEEAALCRIGNADEVVSALLFLAGEGASFITGEVLNVSGGFVI